MNILTLSGYVPIEEIEIGDRVIYFDRYTGEKLENEILSIEKFDRAHWEETHQNGDDPFNFYLINGSIRLFKNQSIWRNTNFVCHAFELQIGDVIYDDNDDEIIVTSLIEIVGTDSDVFWWFSISGDHSYIVDGVTLHNANRYARTVGGNWNADATWSTSSGGTADTTAPTTSDDVLFDSNSTGTVTVNTATTCSCKTIVCSSASNSITFTASMILTVTGNAVTFCSGMTLTGTGRLRLTASCTITSAGVTFPGDLVIGSSGTYTLADALVIAGRLVFADATASTFSGNFNITCGYFEMTRVSPSDASITLVSTKTLTIVSGITVNKGLYGGNITIKASTGSSAFILIYQGTAANCNVMGTIFTDVDASSSAQAITNWNGGTLLRTTNIVNRTVADFGGSNIFGTVI